MFVRWVYRIKKATLGDLYSLIDLIYEQRLVAMSQMICISNAINT